MSAVDLSGARALTVRPPWSHAIAHLGKTIENRGWEPAGGLVGPLLIHAGQRWDRTAELFCARLGAPVPPRRDVTVGAIVAVCRLAGVCRPSATRDANGCDCGPWALGGQRHWRLADVTALPTPVFTPRGQMGLWRPSPEVLADVADQLAPPALAVSAWTPPGRVETVAAPILNGGTP